MEYIDFNIGRIVRIYIKTGIVRDYLYASHEEYLNAAINALLEEKIYASFDVSVVNRYPLEFFMYGT